ncbi:HAD family hydrolase [Alicyclobacillaceae bacterium I2511]|nr:HAD family hydrolase [Alicyclobacillaceae bacterium I2511]
MTTLLFDLDGTLIDTSSVVLPAFTATLKFLGTKIPDTEVLRATFGVPDEEIWKQLLPEGDKALRQVAYVRAQAEICAGIRRTRVLLPETLTVLQKLYLRGHTLSVASNCSSAYLEAVVSSQGLGPLLTHPLCLESVGGHCKADILAAHQAYFGTDPLVMVGDRLSDVEAAKATGLPVVGCAFGFGNPQEVAGANVVIHRLSQLLDLY